ncbi:substrate-binding domain-containing protein [Candidatus Poribacteria bacterium]|nr:substrate-binding domain-containing protein [Candidatus Poribacteria bacterium]
MRSKGWVALLLIPFILACSWDEERLVIFYDEALKGAMEKLMRRFEKVYPRIKIDAEPSKPLGVVCKVIDLKREVDLVALSDPKLIEKMLMRRKLLMPSYAEWYVKFAVDRITIAFTDKSRYADEINSGNWREVLSRDDVRVGRLDPDDPSGRGAALVWKTNSPPGGVYRSTDELLKLLEERKLDYIFTRLSTAKRHRLRYVELPCEITYAVTIPRGAPHLRHAIMFLQLFLGEEGRRVLKEEGYQPISPPLAKGGSKLPKELKRYVGKR